MKLKKLLLTMAVALATITASAQKQGFSYQAVVRDAKGELVCNSLVSLRLSLVGESGQGVMYRETQTPTTNQYGVLSVTVGEGKADNNATLDDVDWRRAIFG